MAQTLKSLIGLLSLRMINSRNIRLSWAHPTFLFNGIILSFGFPKIHHCIFSLKHCVCVLVTQSCPTLHDPWTVAHQALLSMGLSGQEYWSGLPYPFPGIFPSQGLNLGFLHCRRILYHLSHSKEHHCELMLLLVFNMIQVEFWKSCNSRWRRQWHPTPVLLPGKSHGWRSLVGCSPWGR